MEQHRKKGISIRAKLIISYIAMVVIIVCIAVVCIKSISKVYDNSKIIYEGNMQSVNYLKTISQNLREEDRDVVALSNNSKIESRKSLIKEIRELEKENDEIVNNMLTLKISKNEARRFRQCRLSMLSFSKQIGKLVDQIDDKSFEKFDSNYEENFAPVKATTFEMIDAMVVLAEQNAKDMNTRNYNIYKTLLVSSILITIAAFIIAIMIAMFMSRYFNKRLETIQKLAKRISEYDISNDIEIVPDDELGRTMEALNDSQFMMRDLVEKIIDESTAISDMGKEVGGAIRESDKRIDNVNSKIVSTSDDVDDIIRKCKKILDNRDLDDETVEKVRGIIKLLKDEKQNITDISGELYNISTYLSQIVVTSDYQNELADSHKEQVQKFKI